VSNPFSASPPSLTSRPLPDDRMIQSKVISIWSWAFEDSARRAPPVERKDVLQSTRRHCKYRPRPKTS
jgi:hypothetical protein